MTAILIATAAEFVVHVSDMRVTPDDPDLPTEDYRIKSFLLHGVDFRAVVSYSGFAITHPQAPSVLNYVFEYLSRDVRPERRFLDHVLQETSDLLTELWRRYRRSRGCHIYLNGWVQRSPLRPEPFAAIVSNKYNLVGEFGNKDPTYFRWFLMSNPRPAALLLQPEGELRHGMSVDDFAGLRDACQRRDPNAIARSFRTWLLEPDALFDDPEPPFGPHAMSLLLTPDGQAEGGTSFEVQGLDITLMPSMITPGAVFKSPMSVGGDLGLAKGGDPRVLDEAFERRGLGFLLRRLDL